METLLRDPVLAEGEEFFQSVLAANAVTHGKGPYQTSPATKATHDKFEMSTVETADANHGVQQFESR